MAGVTDTWTVDLKLNTTSFQRSVNDVKKQVQSAAGSIGTSVKASIDGSLSGVASSLKSMIQGDIGGSVSAAWGAVGLLAGEKFLVGFGWKVSNNLIKVTTGSFNAIKTLAQNFASIGARVGGAVGDSLFNIALGIEKFASSAVSMLAQPEVLAIAAIISAIAISITGLTIAAVTAGPVMAGFAMGMINFARPFLQAYADVQKLEFGLQRIGATAQQVKDTLQLGKLPGLNRQQAAEGTTKFAAAGFTIEEAQALTVAFSKGATSAEQYGRIITALTQILSKGKLSQEELTQQLGEAVPGFQQILKKAFGMNAEQLVASGMDVNTFVIKLAQQFDQMKTPVGSAQSALDNFDDSIQNLQASFGKGMAGTLLPFIDILTTKIDEFIASGKLEEMGAKFANFAQGIDIDSALNGLLQMADLAATLAGRMSDLVGAWNDFGKSVEWAAGALSYLGDIAALIFGGFVGYGAKQVVDAGMKKQEGKRLANTIKPSGNNTSNGLFEKASQVLKNMTSKPAEDKIIGAVQGRDELMKAQLDALRQITKNTSPDLQKSILGGGNLGSKGVSLLDLTNNRRNNSVKGYSAKVLGLFDQMMEEIMKDFNSANQKMLTTRGGF